MKEIANSELIINQIISSIDAYTGGPSQGVIQFLNELGYSFPDIKIHLHTATSGHPLVESFDQKNISLTFYKKGIFGQLKGLKNGLFTESPSVYHGHGLWQLPIHQMTNVALKNNLPFIITPHGMLQKWSLQQKSIKKKLALRLYQYYDLSKAACIQATSQDEADNIRSLDLKNPIAVIPNGVSIPTISKSKRDNTSKRRALFLSRIVKNKGIEELVRSWQKLPKYLSENWVLEIYGNGEKKYIEQIQTLIFELNLNENVQIKGPVYGDDKKEVFQKSELFILPTYSENFGVAIAEALAFGIPVITTKGAPWEELINNKCGWWIDFGVESLKFSLIEALNKDSEMLKEMGAMGRQLIIKKYSSSVVSEQIYRMYEWVAYKNKIPDFIAF